MCHLTVHIFIIQYTKLYKCFITFQLHILYVYYYYRVAAVVVITVNPGLVVVHLSPKLVIGLNILVLQAKNTIIIVKLKYHSGTSLENG